MAQHWGKELFKNPPFVFGNNTVFKRSALEKSGLYDEKYANNYEDVDISYRLYKNGFSLIYSPSAQVEHLRKDTIDSLLNTYWRWCFQENIGTRDKGDFAKGIIVRLSGIVGTFKNFSWQDLIERNYALMLIDFLLLFYLPVSDLKYFLGQVKKLKP